MPKYNSKKDDNHNEITEALQKCGWHVTDASRYENLGFDCIAKKARTPVYFIEIKDGSKSPSRRTLTDSEIEAQKLYGHYWQLIESFDDVFNFNLKYG